MKQIYTLLCLFSVASLACARLAGEGIVGGDNATEGQFPYQVSVQVYRFLHVCGGGIINKRYVLTAAHCVINKPTNEFTKIPYNIVANSIDLNKRRGKQVIDVEQIIVPTCYKPPSRNCDIAVLKLAEDLVLSDSVQELVLPRTYETYVGQNAAVAGYGMNWVPIEIDEETGDKVEGIGRTSEMLKYLNVSIISNAECRKKNEDKTIGKTNVCAQAHQRHIDGQLEGVCTNDSGGPLVIDNTVIGVLVSSPFGCEESQKAALYTRVFSFAQFINNIMKGVYTRGMRIRDLEKKKDEQEEDDDDFSIESL